MTFEFKYLLVSLINIFLHVKNEKSCKTQFGKKSYIRLMLPWSKIL